MRISWIYSPPLPLALLTRLTIPPLSSEPSLLCRFAAGICGMIVSIVLGAGPRLQAGASQLGLTERAEPRGQWASWAVCQWGQWASGAVP